jgi:hypothetical protein
LNAQEIGEFFVVLTPDGDVWIRREDLDGTRLKKGLGHEITFEKETYVSLRTIEGLEFAINERDVSLEIHAHPDLFIEQALDYSYKKPYEIFYTMDNSAFLNYGLLLRKLNLRSFHRDRSTNRPLPRCVDPKLH